MSLGKKSPKAPAAPDITEMINAQAQANRVNTVNPYGSQTFTQGADGQWNSNVQFSPEMQKLFDKQLGMVNQEPQQYEGQQMGDALRARIQQRLGK